MRCLVSSHACVVHRDSFSESKKCPYVMGQIRTMFLQNALNYRMLHKNVRNGWKVALCSKVEAEGKGYRMDWQSRAFNTVRKEAHFHRKPSWLVVIALLLLCEFLQGECCNMFSARACLFFSSPLLLCLLLLAQPSQYVPFFSTFHYNGWKHDFSVFLPMRAFFTLPRTLVVGVWAQSKGGRE